MSERDLITVDEAAPLLGVSRATVYNYANGGKLTRHPAPYGGRFFLLDRAEVERLRDELAQQREGRGR